MRDVLLFVSGTTPQIVTETIWGLRRAKPAFAPVEIHVVTTSPGRAVLERRLLAEGRLAALFLQFGLAAPPLTFHMIGEPGQAPLDDIRDSQDNTILANTIMTVVRDLTKDPTSMLHASLSGGRKTMSFYLGYALSLYGRANDALYHVMVPSDFERCPDFYYIPMTPEILGTQDGGSISTADATIEVAEIPILKLRSWVDEPLLSASIVDFRSLTAGVQAALSRPTLHFDDDECRITVGSTSFVLRAQLYALYRVLAEACVQQLPGAGPDGVGPAHRGWLTGDDFSTARSRGVSTFLATLERLPKAQDQRYLYIKGVMERAGDRTSVGSAKMAKIFNPIFAHLRSALKAAIPDPSLRAEFWVQSVGRRPVRYGLLLSPERIVLRS